MKAVIYGVGKNFEKYFHDKEFVDAGIEKMGIEVIGCADSSKDAWGKEVVYKGQKFVVKNIDEFQKDSETIIVSTKQYFVSIRDGLIKKGYKEGQVLLADDLFEAYLDEIYDINNFTGKTGMEVGGPTQLFENIYKKCGSCDNVNFSSYTVWGDNKTAIFSYGGRRLGNILITDATDMNQISDETYDFVLSSNNLEHIANPLKALKEFTRLVKTGGIILVLVPRKEKTFDHNREYTKFEHLIKDFFDNIGEDDLSHLPEIIKNHDYSMDIQCGGKEKFIERAKKNIENRCLHHHVFDEDCLRKAFEFAGLRVIDFAKVTDNWLVMGMKC